MAKIKKPSFKIILYTYKRLSNGEHPVMLRVTFDRKQEYFSLRMTATQETWNDGVGRFDRGKNKRLTEKEKDNNAILSKHERSLEKIRKYFEDVEFSSDRFKIEAERVGLFTSSNFGSFFTFTQKVIQDLLDEERIGSALTYRDTLNRVKSFRKDKDLSFRDIDVHFLEAFKKHLLPTNSVNSIGVYLRTLKAIYNRAVWGKLVKEEFSPWKGFSIKTEKTRKRALSRKQLDALKEYKAEPGSSQWHSLNYFLFSYYARGMNFNDIARLTPDNIREGRIFYTRKKPATRLI